MIEGLDGSGKQTQAGLLRASLIERGADLRSVSFPRYGSASSALVRMYLGGRFGSDPGDVNAYAASAFYAVDRYASCKEDWGAFYESGGTVLADRWTTSNAMHQCSKLPREEWDSYLEWLYGFEYGLLGVPEPDLVVYLDMDPEAGARLVEERCAREGISKDIHEADAAYLARCREAAGVLRRARRLGARRVRPGRRAEGDRGRAPRGAGARRGAPGGRGKGIPMTDGFATGDGMADGRSRSATTASPRRSWSPTARSARRRAEDEPALDRRGSRGASAILAARNLAHADAVAGPAHPKSGTLYLRFGKRALDVALSGIALLLTLPVNLVLAVLTYRDVGSPIFYVQERTGKDLKSFKMVKFRNMTEERDEDGELLPPGGAHHEARPVRAEPLARRALELLERPQGRHVAHRP